MNSADRDELLMTPSAKVIRSLKMGDRAAALAHCGGLVKEYVLLHKGLRIAVQLLLRYNDLVFCREQAAVTQRIEAAVASHDVDDALRLLNSKREGQYRPLNGLLIQYLSSTAQCILRHLDEEVLRGGEVSASERQSDVVSASMDCAGRSEPSWPEGSPSHAVEEALRADQIDQALSLCAGPADEFVATVKELISMASQLVEYKEQLARRTQAAIAGRISSAVAAGDFPLALALLDQKRHEHLDLRDLDITLLASSWSWLYRAFGDQALLECHRYTAEGQRAGFEDWDRQSPEDLLRSTTFLASLQAYGKYAVEEDDEKFTVICQPCGSGGKLLWDGLYDPPNARYARVARPQPVTFGRPDFPVYCTHCAVWNNLAPVDWFGHPLWVQTPGVRAGDPCMLRIYKHPRDIPLEYYRLLGREKPNC